MLFFYSQRTLLSRFERSLEPDAKQNKKTSILHLKSHPKLNLFSPSMVTSKKLYLQEGEMDRTPIEVSQAGQQPQTTRFHLGLCDFGKHFFFLFYLQSK
jgi:hypothetical protein